MQVRKSDIFGGLKGSINKDQYARAIPGNSEWYSICQKHTYSKKEKEAMAQRPAVLKFSAITKQAAAILKDPAQKAQWQQRHIEAKREASRHQKHADINGKPAVPARLYDFIRHELSKETL